MEKVLHFLLFPLLLCGVLLVQAQHECDLYINADFDSECLLTEYIKERPSLWEQGLENCLLACKGNTVQYTAVCSGNVIQYSWTISGASSYYFTNQNKTAVVTWGNNNDVGHISVNVVTSDTNTCTAEACVLLMESPQIASSTVPAYYIDQYGDKVIEICLDETIELMDMSTAGQTPIVGYFWETPFGDASTPNHTITANQTGDYIIIHRVQNECGCEGYEEIKLKVVKSEPLELSCYGTVCAKSQESYTLLNPYCSQYMWSVEGGTYTSDPSNPATINVQWGEPASGYGIISIDATFCNSPCKALTSIKIPVISQNTTISGPDVVCVGDFQQFELPVWGSTSYSWQTFPSANVNIANTEELNQVLLQFTQVGTYSLQCTYECEFLGCGPYYTTKTIVVKDTMSINSGDNTLCKGATGHYTTWHGNSVSWRVYNQNNALIYYTNGIALNYTFTNAGKYKIVASNSNYCDDAEYLVTVLNNPPALTNTNGPHSACLGSSILLSASPSHPNYYLEWVPICDPFNTQNGDEVTIYFDDEVCDVAVYQIDAENGCRSAAYIHEVDTFQLAPSNLPPSVSACAGGTFSHTVPFQENVLYEWIISPAGVASIQGDHFDNHVTILVNHLANNQPTSAVVTLKRTCCSGDEYVESFLLTTIDFPTPTISYSTPVCQGDNAHFYVTSSVTNPSDYTWHIGGSNYVGNTASHIFTQTGNQSFTLDYQPYPACPAVVVTGIVEVVPLPVVTPYYDGQDVGVIYYPNASYVWELNGNQISETGNIITNASPGTYCCTVTYTTTPSCSSSGCITIGGGGNPGGDCIAMPCSSSVTCTTATVFLTNNSGGDVTWSMTPQIPGNVFTSTDNTSASLSFSYPGVYTVMATATVNEQCYIGITTCTIECVPDFSLSYTCNNPVAFEDRTLTLASGLIVSRNIYIQETGYTYNNVGSSTTFPITSFVLGGTNHVTMTVFLSNGQQCQITKELIIDALPTISSLNISQYMCEGTPYYFSANAIGDLFIWNFGDGTYAEGNNIYHTFSNTSNVTLVVFNDDGCSISSNPAYVYVVHNDIEDGFLSAIGQDVCPGSVRQIAFTPHFIVNNYFWNYSSSSISTNIYNTYQTGDYHVLVTNTFGCKKEALQNVRFLNAPTARITGNTVYCFGEEVKLNGNTGSGNQYLWTISGQESHTYTTANITFTPGTAGIYYVNLNVTSPDGCVRSATCTVTVHQQPAAPPISFYGNECIHTPPVYVHSTSSPIQSLLWSNGFHGSSAQYYVPGFLTAHYIDPTTGCPSAKSTLFIPPAPNYDALLTGCYERCQQEIPDTLHVYNFYPYNSGSFYWDWYENNIWSVGGSTLYADLPLNNFGYYYMNTQYGNGCVVQSPRLEIDGTQFCACDSITVGVKKDCYPKECSLHYSMTITISNLGSQPAYFDQLYTNANSNILYVSPMPVTVAPGSYQTINVTLEFLEFANPYIEFTLRDNYNNCEKTFTEYFEWEQCIEEECKMELDKITFLDVVSSPHQTSYFDVNVFFPNDYYSILAMWSTPPQISQVFPNPPFYANGLLMLNYGQLSQMALTGEPICIHAVICTKEQKLCYVKLCIRSNEFLNLIPEEFRQLPDSITADTDSTRNFQSGSFIPQADKPYLVPNPARDEVAVMGIAPEEVAEIAVLTMQGGQVADFRNDYRFNVSRLAKASYIVRVVTTNKEVYYLKLVKQ